MPNEIYRTTHAGLAGLVSPRAATRLLDRALRRAGLDAERLEAIDAQRLLRGRLRRDLEAILPAHGLRRQLARLDRHVTRLGRTAGAEAPANEARDTTDDAAPVAPTEAPPRTGIAARPAPARWPRRHGRDVLRAVAERPAVRGVIRLHEDGVRDARGRDVDSARAAEAVTAATRRLARHGTVRSLLVHTSAGHVCAHALTDGMLVVHGQERLNLGAIFVNALQLEEEP